MDLTYTILLPALEFFAKGLHSYGWAIIALTVAIRICLWPLVSSQTKSMQKMSQLAPMQRKILNQYKDKPEIAQKKVMEFYSKNKINPFGSCLPMLIQLPILLALYATFSGPPFQDKPIPVKVTVVEPSQSQRYKCDQTSQANSPYISQDGSQAKIVVHPGETTLVLGRNKDNVAGVDGKSNIDFWVTASEGQMPSDFKVKWKISQDHNKAMITDEGVASFPQAGKVVVEATVSQEGSRTPGSSPEPQLKPSEIKIPVTIDVITGDKPSGWNFGQSEDSFLSKTRLSNASAEATVDGKTIKLLVSPGESSIQAGKSARFSVVPADGGELPDGLNVSWRIANDPSGSSIDENGHAVFTKPGEVIVEAIVPGIAKTESFYFIGSLGKVAVGMKLLKPDNFDVLAMVVLMGVTMILSQKLMVQPPSPDMDPEQAAIQKQTQTMMPIAFTVMFFFIPLPAGVLLYFVISNIIQSLQTWFIMRTPAPALVSGLEDNVEIVVEAKSNDQKDEQSSEDATSLKSTGNKKKSGKKK